MVDIIIKEQVINTEDKTFNVIINDRNIPLGNVCFDIVNNDLVFNKDKSTEVVSTIYYGKVNNLEDRIKGFIYYPVSYTDKEKNQIFKEINKINFKQMFKKLMEWKSKNVYDEAKIIREGYRRAVYSNELYIH